MKYLLLFLLLIAGATSYAEIYKWVDENGKVHFSDSKPQSAKAETLELEINTYTQVSLENSIKDVGSKRVVMYATKWCGYCKKARNYFKKNKIRFVEYDIETNGKAKREYDKMGATGVPVILVGKKRMNGFSESRFEQIYQ